MFCMKKIFSFIILVISVLQISVQTAQKNTPAVKPSTSGNPLLYGMFSAPAGTSTVLQNNGKNDLTLTAPKGGKTYLTNSFNFSTPLPKDSSYKVTLKKTAGGQTCVIYAGAVGIMSPND